MVETGPEIQRDSSRSSSRITSKAFAATQAAPAPKSEPTAKATDSEAGCSGVAWATRWGKGQLLSWRREEQTLQQNDLHSLYLSMTLRFLLQNVHVCVSSVGTNHIAMCLPLLGALGRLALVLSFTCHALCHPFVPPLLVLFGRAFLVLFAIC